MTAGDGAGEEEGEIDEGVVGAEGSPRDFQSGMGRTASTARDRKDE